MKCDLHRPNGDIFKSFEEASSFYQENGVLLLNNVFPSANLAAIQALFKKEFTYHVHEDQRASEFKLFDQKADFIIRFALMGGDFKEKMAKIIDVDRAKITSRVYFNTAECGELDWHSDWEPGSRRIAALRIEMSDEDYTGGTFHLRKQRQSNHEFKIEDATYNSGTLFKIDFKELEHRVDPVVSGIRKSVTLFFEED